MAIFYQSRLYETKSFAFIQAILVMFLMLVKASDIEIGCFFNMINGYT